MLPADHPAAIPDVANERWTLLQESSLEALLFYVFVFGGVLGHKKLAEFFQFDAGYSLVFLDAFAIFFLVTRLADSFFTLRGKYRASSLIVDVTNFVNVVIVLTAAVGYLMTVRVHLSWEIYVLSVLLISAVLFSIGALARTKVRKLGGENILDSIDLDSIGLNQDQFDKNERYKNIQRNLIENAIVFFLPATFALPGFEVKGIADELKASELIYAVLVGVFVVSRAVHTAAFLGKWQPTRSIFWFIGVAANVALYAQFIYFTIMSNEKATLVDPFVTIHFCILFLSVIAVIVACITFSARIKQGVKSVPEDRFMGKRVPSEYGLGEVGAFLDVHRYVVEALVLLSFTILAEELPGVTYRDSLTKSWWGVGPIVAFVAFALITVLISLFPRTRRYNTIIFLLSYCALLLSWATEEYQYFETQL